MTHPLYLELLQLTADPNGKAAVNLASRAQETTLPETRKAFRISMKRNFFPPTREGEMFYKTNFWAVFCNKRIWHTAWEGTDAQKDSAAEWLKTRREAAQKRDAEAWPPKATFQRASTPPQPRTGKE